MSAAPHRWPVRVYYEDTDFSGVVYHAGYLRFMERARTELLREAGISHAGLAAEGPDAPAFAVRSMRIEFLAAAHMDDLLAVETRVAALGGASVTLQQAVLRGEARLVEAEVRIALVAGGRAWRLPPALRARLDGTAHPGPRS